METLNAAGRHSVGLPSINNIAADSVKREELDYTKKSSAPAMVSPLHPYPGPSHSYSNHQSVPASSLPSAPLGGLLSPPTSRRQSDDEKDQQRPPPPRQSLPSISEALGKEPPSLPYPPPPPPPPPPSAPASAAPPFYALSTAAAPVEPPRTRTFSVDHINNPVPPNLFTQPPRSPYSNNPATAPPPSTSHAQSDLSRTTYSSAATPQKLPALHPLRTTQSPPLPAPRSNQPYPAYPPPPSVQEAPAPHSAGPMNPPYGYAPYPPSYPLSAPAPSAPNSAYPSSAVPYSAPSQYPHSSWAPKNPEFSKPQGKPEELAPYGATIKRHLEKFDFEASLNEMSEGAGRVAEFSKTYRERAHNSQRTGITGHTIPSVVEVDEILKQSQKIQFSLQRIREVVVSHQQANQMDAPREAHYRPTNGYDHEGQSGFQDDPKAGSAFGALDPNKRTKRGRAAPPGRCHSCSRVETPEWRRGPDGARTLCNACGLHYAKMSRRMGGKQPSNTQIGWQRNENNLRPKALGGGSSAA